VSSAEREPHHVSQESGGFVSGEAQVGGLDLGHLIPGPEFREGEGRISACSNHETDVLGQMLDQEGDGLVDVLRVDQVVIV
jgi:hypothetical protein